MAATTKKSSNTVKTKPRRPKVKTFVAARAQTVAELRQELQECQLQLTKALQREKGDSQRERASGSGSQGIIGAASCDEQDSGCHCQITDGYSAGARCGR